MTKYFKHKKTGKVISEEQYKAQLIEEMTANSQSMSYSGMDILDNPIEGDLDEYEEYFEEEDTDSDES